MISISLLNNNKKCKENKNESNLQTLLENLIKKYSNIRIASIVSIEGFPIISILPSNIKDVQVAATTATILCMAERALVELHAGELEQLYIQGTLFKLLLFKAGQDAVLLIALSKEVNQKHIFPYCTEINNLISELI